MKKIIYLIAFLPRFLSAQEFDAGSPPPIFGIATPIVLELPQTRIFLEDYFSNVSQIDSFSWEYKNRAVLSENKKLLDIKTDYDFPILNEIKFWVQGTSYSILVKKSKKRNVTIQFDPGRNEYTTVQIKGDFNGWTAANSPMKLENGIWKIIMPLMPGRYQYQIVADSNAMLDPNNPEKIDNGSGGFNSLLRVGNISPSSVPKIATRLVKEDSVYINYSDPTNSPGVSFFVFWNNYSVPQRLTRNNDIAFKIPPAAQKVKRSYIRVYAANGISVANDILIPLEYGKVIVNPAELTRGDYQTMIMYFMMVDRFKNGNKSNDRPVVDARVLPQANYYGGDLNGIMDKLNDGYFDQIGINSLWISPITQNPWGAYQEYPEPKRWFSGYHGYWPISLSQVDKRFGDNELFLSLVKEAHTKSMNVVLDYVANHVHAEHPLWTMHPDWFTKLDLPDGRKNLRLWDEERLSTWFEPFMPSLDHSQPKVADAISDSALFWVKQFNIDGFRHDATKHIETEFWRLLTRKLKMQYEIPYQKDVYQIGETFGSRELIGSYIGSGLLDAQFDFNLYFDARSVFARDEASFEQLSASLHETFDYYGYHHLMGNITGNHDLARFISYAGGGLKWNENDKEVGWHREIKVDDPVGYKKLEMFEAFILTIPGIPIIYYGDEIGMPGANDPDNRRMMKFDSLNAYETGVKEKLSTLTNLRKENIALIYGDFLELSKTNDTYAYKRHYFNNEVYIYFNKSDEIKRFTQQVQNSKIPVAYNAKQMNLTDNKFELQVNPFSYAIVVFK